MEGVSLSVAISIRPFLENSFHPIGSQIGQALPTQSRFLIGPTENLPLWLVSLEP
jgi:hypothetical protein